MTSATAAALNREVLERPRDPDFVALYEIWRNKRGLRAMPSLGDFDPAEFSRVLPHVQLCDVGPGEGVYRVRKVGSALVALVGGDNTGKVPGEGLPERTAKTILTVLDTVVWRAAPMFIRGRVLWVPGMTNRRFEACALPLSDDGARVSTVLSALKLQ